MIKQSIGLIETVGLSAAIVAADTAVKSANVTLVGYELTKGGGLVAVKILGEVGAVNAAIAAASIAAAKVGQVYATKVIARVAEGIDLIINSNDTKIQAQQPEATKIDKLESIEIKVITEKDEVQQEIQQVSNNTVTQAPQTVTKPDEDKKIANKGAKDRGKLPPTKGKK